MGSEFQLFSKTTCSVPFVVVFVVVVPSFVFVFVFTLSFSAMLAPFLVCDPERFYQFADIHAPALITAGGQDSPTMNLIFGHGRSEVCTCTNLSATALTNR